MTRPPPVTANPEGERAAGSRPENHAATAAHRFDVIGLEERNRNRALEIEPGDRIVLYMRRAKAFAGSIRVEGELYEDREKIWPVSDHDATVLMQRLGARTGAAA
jgi:hypothetical protein